MCYSVFCVIQQMCSATQVFTLFLIYTVRCVTVLCCVILWTHCIVRRSIRACCVGSFHAQVAGSVLATLCVDVSGFFIVTYLVWMLSNRIGDTHWTLLAEGYRLALWLCLAVVIWIYILPSLIWIRPCGLTTLSQLFEKNSCPPITTQYSGLRRG